MTGKSEQATDPVLPDQGGRTTPVDPGGSAKEDAVRRRAYELYLRRGRKNGYELQDWLDAEAQLCAEGLRAQTLKLTGT